MSVKAVIWQPEGGVWYRGKAIDYICDPNADGSVAVDGLIRNEYLTTSDLKRWSKIAGKGFRYAGSVLALIGDLLSGPWPSSHYTAEELKEYNARVMSRLAGIGIVASGGTTLGTVRKKADEVEITRGSAEAVRGMKLRGLRQIAGTNDLDPFVFYVSQRLGGIDSIEAAPAAVYDFVGTRPFRPGDDERFTISGTHRGEYNGVREALRRVKEMNLQMDDVLLVCGDMPDASSMKCVMEGGGVAVGFNPCSDAQKMLQREGIPVLMQAEPDAEPLLDISMDRSKVGYYCQ